VTKIVIASDSDINDLDPQNFKSDSSYAAVENLYDGLFDLEAQPATDGTWRASAQDVVGEIIESYELSEDETVLTLRVRPGVRFSDGTPCLASSIQFTLERALLGPGYLSLMMDMLAVTTPEQIRLLDDYTLELRLPHRNPLLWYLLPLNSFSVMDPLATKAHATPDDAWAANWYRDHASGTGPYTLSQRVPGEQYLFEPNPLYWQREVVDNDGVLLTIVPSADARMAALQRGDVDVALGLEPHHLAQCADDPNLRVHRFPSTYCKVMSLNTSYPPFDDVRVRQAVSYAIPYEQLRREAMGDYCQPLVSPIPAGMPGHDPSVWKYNTNLERARQLLADAGFSDGFAARLVTQELRADEVVAAHMVQRALQPLGVEVEIVKLSEVEYFAHLKEFPLAMFQTFSWVNDPIYHLKANLEGGTGKNLANYNSPRVNQLIEQALYEPDAERRLAMSREAQRIIMEDAPWALLYQPHYTVVTTANTRGYAAYPDMIPRYRYLSKKPFADS
jgi:peptide/nickel transport system substrate-binding protein